MDSTEELLEQLTPTLPILYAYEQLDSEWRRGVAPNLAQLLRKAKRTLDASVELCAADIEWRWRNDASNKAVSEILSTDKNLDRPFARDYRELLEDFWNVEECQRRMFESEWVARSAWGDQPRVDQFLEQIQFSGLSSSILLDKLDLIAKLSMTVWRQGECLVNFHVPPELVVGRQKDNELPPPAWLAECHRLLVVDNSDRHYSREQFRIRRTKVDELEVTNLSRKIPLHLDNANLKPSESTHVGLPFRLAVNDLSLHIVADTYGC